MNAIFDGGAIGMWGENAMKKHIHERWVSRSEAHPTFTHILTSKYLNT
jgi:hypothetical protein